MQARAAIGGCNNAPTALEASSKATQLFAPYLHRRSDCTTRPLPLFDALLHPADKQPA